MTITATARIYALVDPRDGEIRYVGRTTLPLATRLRAHLCIDHRKPTSKRRWLDEIQALGIRPVIRELEKIVGDRNDWAAAEGRWIARAQAEGAQLTNAPGRRTGAIAAPHPKGRLLAIGLTSELDARLRRHKERLAKAYPWARISTSTVLRNLILLGLAESERRRSA